MSVEPNLSAPLELPDPAPTPSNSTSLATRTEVLQVFSGIAAFDQAQRMARALCSSSLVPKEYQGQNGLANSLIALEIAARMGLSPLVVMQNMTPIHGRPTWSSKFLIATVNASGRFTPLRFVFDNKDNPSRCFAVASDRATGEVLEGETITLELARKEGWLGRSGSKWQTMPGQMLRYRAASWWANVYCPEIALGLMTQEEALDLAASTAESMPSGIEHQPDPSSDASIRPGKTPTGDPDESGADTLASNRIETETTPSSDALLLRSPATGTKAPHRSALPAIESLTSPEELDAVDRQISALLASGEISDTRAERLWNAVEKQRSQLELKTDRAGP